MEYSEILSNAAWYLWKAFCAYASLILIIPLASVYQEHLIWSRSNAIPSLNWRGYIKVYLLNVFWMFWTFCGSLVLLPLWLLGFDKQVETWSHTKVEKFAAKFCISAFVAPVQVVGQQHLPPYHTPSNTVAPVYIANHASQIDVGAVYFLERHFKWIAKQSVLYLPGVGTTMVLGKHIFINRKTGQNTGSVSNLYEKSNHAIQNGTPMFIFPQGTRRISERLQFKNGAFTIALENKCDVVCISIQIPMSAWNDWYPISLLWNKAAPVEPIVLTVHPSIQVKGTEDKEELKKQCFDTIYSVLPEIGEATTAKEDKKDK